MPPTSEHKPSKLLLVIGVGKLMKAAVLFGAAYALRHLRRSGDVGQTLIEWAKRIHQDPDGKHLRRLIEHATLADPRHLHLTGIALFIYATLFTGEGVGLLMRKRWGEYLTVVITSLLLPLEVYELFEPSHKGTKVALLVVNLAIVAYLVWNLYRTRPNQPRAEPAATVAAG